MAPLTSRPLVEVLDALASTAPVPAGGSASALAGAAGASLLLMAATLPRTRSGSTKETTELASAAVRLRPLRAALVELVDRDAEAYAALITAMRKPKGGTPDPEQQFNAVAAATRTATEVPLDMMRVSRQALGAALAVASHCSRVASADVNAAIELLVAAVRGAGGSVDANLGALKDADYVDRIGAERRTLEVESLEDAEKARGQL
jgi:formiminotetrahydrofolate cyclodeaminase